MVSSCQVPYGTEAATGPSNTRTSTSGRKERDSVRVLLHATDRATVVISKPYTLCEECDKVMMR